MRHGLSRSSRAWLRGRTFGLIALAAAGAMASSGCSSHQPAELTLTSLAGKRTYHQAFSHGFIGRNAHGDQDIVLTASAERPGGRDCVLRQLMHIRVLWEPGHPVKTDGSSTANASVQWYVYTDDGHTPGQAEMIEYSGTAMVALQHEDGGAKVTITRAALHPTFACGDLTDPVGDTRFEGTIEAQRNPEQVEALLSDVRTSLASAAARNSAVRRAAADARSSESPLLP